MALNVSINRLVGPSTLGGSLHFTQVVAGRRGLVTVASPSSTTVKHPYFVARNTRGSLPVYTDIRNGGTRYMVLVRNVDGNANAMAKDLSSTLFPAHSEEALRMKVQVHNSRHVVIQGGHWKHNVMEWLRRKGF